MATATTRALELNHVAFTETVNQRPELSLLLIRSISSRLRFATTEAFLQRFGLTSLGELTAASFGASPAATQPFI